MKYTFSIETEDQNELNVYTKAPDISKCLSDIAMLLRNLEKYGSDPDFPEFNMDMAAGDVVEKIRENFHRILADNDVIDI